MATLRAFDTTPLTTCYPSSEPRDDNPWEPVSRLPASINTIAAAPLLMDLELAGHDHDPGSKSRAATSGARTRDQDAADESTEAQPRSRGHRDGSDDSGEPAHLWTKARSTHRRRTSGYGTASFDRNVSIRRQRNSRKASIEPMSEDDASDHGEQHQRAPSRLPACVHRGSAGSRLYRDETDDDEVHEYRVRSHVTLPDRRDDPGETRRATTRNRRSGSRHRRSSNRRNGRRWQSSRVSEHGSSSEDDSDGAVVQHAGSRRHRIKPRTFVETLWAHFENCAGVPRRQSHRRSGLANLHSVGAVL